MNIDHIRTQKYAAIAVLFGIVQFIAVQLAVQTQWHTPYSWSANNISDLNNRYCGTWGDDLRYVCSPHHALMSASFIVYGVSIIVASLSFSTAFGRGKRAAAGRTCVFLAGVGVAVAGFFPADVNLGAHLFGALLLFFVGNVGLLFVQPQRRGFRLSARLFGALGLVGLVLYFSHNYMGLGMGGLERVVVYLRDLWFVGFALLVLRSSLSEKRAS